MANNRKQEYRKKIRNNGSRFICKQCCCCGNAFMTDICPIYLADRRPLWLCNGCTKLFEAKYQLKETIAC